MSHTDMLRSVAIESAGVSEYMEFHGVVIPMWILLLLPLATADTSSKSYCDTTYYCASTETCCPSSTGKWQCCPYGAATCCSDNKHCCPSAYPVCDLAHSVCRNSGLLALAGYFSGSTSVDLPSAEESVPETFDARTVWPTCVDEPKALPPCEAYLYSPISVVYDRLCIAGVASQGVDSGLSAVMAELPADTECNSSLYDYAVLYSVTYGLPTDSGRHNGRYKSVSLERELQVKRALLAGGPVAVKVNPDFTGKLVGWTSTDWVVLDPALGRESLLPLDSRGAAAVYEVR